MSFKYTVLIMSFVLAVMSPDVFAKEDDLFLAIDQGQVAHLSGLLNKTNLQSKNTQGESLLIYSVGREQVEIVHLLLKKKIKVDEPDHSGQTALLYAVSQGNTKLAQDLMTAGASPAFLQGAAKENILFEAARMGNLELIKFVSKKNKKLVSAKNKVGESPLWVAIASGQSKAALELIRLGSDLSLRVAGKDLIRHAQDSGVLESSALMRLLRTQKQAD